MPTKKIVIDTKDKPYTSNYPPLEMWLKKIDARCHSQIPVGDPKKPEAYFEMWYVNHPTAGSMTFCILVRGKQRGWEIYTPALTNAIDATLLDAERRLGITGEVSAEPVAEPMNAAGLDACMTQLAQGVINIDEGHTNIEPTSRIHRAMSALISAFVRGEIVAK